MESGAFLAVAFASLFNMDTWQGNLYEPVTLHKYLYANANPVKYKDPSGNMGSLQECNLVSAISAELYKNQNVVMGMAVLNGIGKSVMTGLCGGDAGDMTAAFMEGVIEGAAMGMLFCAVAAVLATSMLTVMMAHTAASSVVSIVLAIYSVSEGDYLNALVYGAVAAAGIIGVCRWYKVTYQIDYVGEKGIARFAGGENLETKNPLADIQYTDKVKSQMELGDYHSFSKYVDRFGANGNITNIIGGDGIVRIKVEIPGSYRGRDGVFQYIIEPDGSTCNHRLFVTK